MKILGLLAGFALVYGLSEDESEFFKARLTEKGKGNDAIASDLRRIEEHIAEEVSYAERRMREKGKGEDKIEEEKRRLEQFYAPTRVWYREMKKRKEKRRLQEDQKRKEKGKGRRLQDGEKGKGRRLETPKGKGKGRNLSEEQIKERRLYMRELYWDLPSSATQDDVWAKMREKFGDEL